MRCFPLVQWTTILALSFNRMVKCDFMVYKIPPMTTFKELHLSKTLSITSISMNEERYVRKTKEAILKFGTVVPIPYLVDITNPVLIVQKRTCDVMFLPCITNLWNPPKTTNTFVGYLLLFRLWTYDKLTPIHLPIEVELKKRSHSSVSHTNKTKLTAKQTIFNGIRTLVIHLGAFLANKI